MLFQAMNVFQVAKREHKENVKAQYTDKKGGNGAIDYFRASGMGYGDRKLIYTFFGHQLPKSQGRSAKNLRQLENGDYVHDRYQTAWEEMGVLISMEERLSSRDDEYLAQYPWEWAGHYDGELDMYLLRAFALEKVSVGSVKNEETGEWEIEVDLDEAYANAIGIFDETGDISQEYLDNRPRLLADIKTMNPWGFDKIKKNGDVSNIAGYLDQISFYMYMKNTPYGSIFIENKADNDVVEVQVLWKDMHDGIEYTWDVDLHGEQTEAQVRVVIDSERFFGGAHREGCVQRIDRLYSTVEKLREAHEAGDTETIAQLMPGRCEGVTKADAFPCSWGHKKGEIQKCEYFDHCWSTKHQGKAVAPYEECPPEAIWTFEDDEEGTEIRIDSRKVPSGVDYDGFLQLVGMGVLDYTKFLVGDEASEEDVVESDEALETAVNADNLFTNTGELNLMAPPVQEEGEAPQPSEAVEYTNADGKKAIKCTNCQKEVTYQRLGNGGTKKCDFCSHTNRVVKL